MITERTLKRWRKEALEFHEEPYPVADAVTKRQLHDRILRMTQELLDSHLMRKETR